jgi:hypothetical protein
MDGHLAIWPHQTCNGKAFRYYSEMRQHCVVRAGQSYVHDCEPPALFAVLFCLIMLRNIGRLFYYEAEPWERYTSLLHKLTRHC